MATDPDDVTHDRPFDSADWLLPIVEDLAVPRAGSNVLLLAGGPCTGKSAAVAQRLDHEELRRRGGVEVDPALIRERLPEFAPRTATAAAAVRVEAEHLARRIVLEALDLGLDLVVHGMGAGEPHAFRRILEALVEGGHRVSVLLVDCATEVALARNEQRGRESGLRYDER